MTPLLQCQQVTPYSRCCNSVPGGLNYEKIRRRDVFSLPREIFGIEYPQPPPLMHPPPQWTDETGLVWLKWGAEMNRLLRLSNAVWACDDQLKRVLVEVRSLDRSLILWGGPISNCFYLGRIHSATLGREDKSQEWNRPCVKLALLHLGE